MKLGGVIASIVFVGYIILWFTIFILLPAALINALVKVIFG